MCKLILQLFYNVAWNKRRFFFFMKKDKKMKAV